VNTDYSVFKEPKNLFLLAIQFSKSETKIRCLSAARGTDITLYFVLVNHFFNFSSFRRKS
jgi:hypothetical protein